MLSHLTLRTAAVCEFDKEGLKLHLEMLLHLTLTNAAICEFNKKE